MGRCALRHARRARSHKQGRLAATYKNVLGALGVEYWNSTLGVGAVGATADTWTGQWRGTVWQAPAAIQRPVYQPDGTIGGGKNAVQCATIGTLCLKASGLPTLIASGTRPYTLSRARLRGVGTLGAFPTILCFGTTATDSFLVYNATGGAAGKYALSQPPGGVSGPTVDTSIHTIECWADGTNVYVAVDGSVTSSASVASMPANVTAINCGVALSADVTCAATSNWLHLIASAYPGASAAAQLRALAVAEFPA